MKRARSYEVALGASDVRQITDRVRHRPSVCGLLHDGEDLAQERRRGGKIALLAFEHGEVVQTDQDERRRYNHAFAILPSRFTVVGEISSTVAVSSRESPPKYRSSTNLACRGSTDATGALGEASVIVAVSELAVTATALPAVIAFGQSARLNAIVQGGVSPYRFSWSPPDFLDDFERQDPIASPPTTRTYTVRVCDSRDVCVEDSVSVIVNPSPAPTAFFTFSDTCCPRTLTLEASRSTGVIVSYAWDLSWTSVSPDLVRASSAAEFLVGEGVSGTITLTVTGSGGQTATVSDRFP
jgi:hypothetical protein